MGREEPDVMQLWVVWGARNDEPCFWVGKELNGDVAEGQMDDVTRRVGIAGGGVMVWLHGLMRSGKKKQPKQEGLSESPKGRVEMERRAEIRLKKRSRTLFEAYFCRDVAEK